VGAGEGENITEFWYTKVFYKTTEKGEDNILARLREAESVDRRQFELVEVRSTIAELLWSEIDKVVLV